MPSATDLPRRLDVSMRLLQTRGDDFHLKSARRHLSRVAPLVLAPRNVACWHKADMTTVSSDVRFRG
jgi:hypothetical protein